MPNIPIALPPGVAKNGTKYQTQGRWFDATLVRWLEGAMEAVGGWLKVQAGGSDIDLTEAVQGMFSWRDNPGKSRLATGTKDQCWTFIEGALTDITPVGFTAGNDDATTGQTYGSGEYGAGLYGEGDPTQEAIVEAQSWQFDNFGELLVAMAHSDGVLYSWDLNALNNLSVVDASAPIENSGLVVTPERFLVALGADNDPRKVQWADQESLTVWGATATNQAGDFNLPDPGEIMTGQRGKSETLIWTSSSLWSMRFIGGTLIYSFQRAGTNCGPISRRSMAMVDSGRAIWMGTRSFYIYDGFVKSIPSEVSDFVFDDINTVQRSKIHAVTMSDFGEVWWFYPSAGSTDIDRYVTYNYREGHWSVGSLNRTAGVDRSVFDFPIMADKTGAIYHHERGDSYLDTGGSALTPFAESGPVEIAQGNNILIVREIIPDEDTLGEVQAKIFSALYPTSTETEHGPFTLAEPTSVRLSGRQVRLRVEQVTPDWKVGTFRLEGVPGGRR